MKHILIFLIYFLVPLSVAAQDNVYLKITDVNNNSLQTTMENNVSRLLTSINKAETSHSDSVNFSGISITEDAKEAIAMLWENVHMRVVDDEIVARCTMLKTHYRVRGYEIQNIAVEMKPSDSEYTGNRNQEVTISFDLQGHISDFVISTGIHQYTTLMKDAVDLDDMDKRMQILHYVEQFRTAYCQKDLEFMQTIFSSDALIITGRKVIKKSPEFGLKATFEYTRHSKSEYLASLSRIFTTAKYLNVKFSNITIERNGSKPYFYGVTCTQEWNSGRWNGFQYSDLGRVFMLWDFSDEEHPVIHVRTWQNTEDNYWFTTHDFQATVKQ